MADHSALQGKKILVIDDEPDVVTYLGAIIEDNGMTAISARDGAEGIARARSEKPDLITLDISMPEKSGVRMLRELQADPAIASIPVVVVTGLSKDFKGFIHKRRHLDPPDGYIAKPIDEAEVLSVLSRLLG